MSSKLQRGLNQSPLFVTMVSVLLIICLSNALILVMVGRVYNDTESSSHNHQGDAVVA